MDDIEAMFGDAGAEADKQSASATTTVNTTATREPVKFNIWEDEPVPREFVIADLKRNTKTYTIASFGKVPYDLLDKVPTLAKLLVTKGYTLNAPADTKDKLLNEAIENTTEVKYYLPFKKANLNVTPTVAYPYKDAYDISANYAFKYENLKPGLKSYLAAGIHLLTGVLCEAPVDFILLYTECGKEDDNRIDYKAVGSNISTLLKYATILNIPVFNLGNADAIERLTKHLGE